MLAIILTLFSPSPKLLTCQLSTDNADQASEKVDLALILKVFRRRCKVTEPYFTLNLLAISVAARQRLVLLVF